MSTREINSQDLYMPWLRNWWLIVALVIIGGILGLLFTKSRTPLYEASASILISVDRNRASVRDDITLYQADDRVRALVLSDDTLERALNLLRDGESKVLEYRNPADFRSAIKISQTPASIHLYVYSTDPQQAADGANAWSSASLTELQEAYVHAVRSAELQGVLYEAHCKLEVVDPQVREYPVWVCRSGGSEIEADELPEALLEEVRASKGILPFYSIAPGASAAVPSAPILWSRSSFLIGGAILGLIAGLLSTYLIGKTQVG